jgi:hypothetical protein
MKQAAQEEGEAKAKNRAETKVKGSAGQEANANQKPSQRGGRTQIFISLSLSLFQQKVLYCVLCSGRISSHCKEIDSEIDRFGKPHVSARAFARSGDQCSVASTFRPA